MNRHIEDILEKNGYFICTIVGVSMFPMLRNRKDSVVIKPVERKLEVYDVPLYRRGNDYVLHRIIDIKDNGYVIRGDNCLNNEFVLESQIVGVMDSFYRGKRLIKLDDPMYRFYSKMWCFLYPIRLCYMKVKRILVKGLKRCLRK